MSLSTSMPNTPSFSASRTKRMAYSASRSTTTFLAEYAILFGLADDFGCIFRRQAVRANAHVICPVLLLSRGASGTTADRNRAQTQSRAEPMKHGSPLELEAEAKLRIAWQVGRAGH